MKKKTLFVRLSSLGDIVLTESTIRYYRLNNPDTEIHFLTKPEYARLIRNYFLVDKVHEYKKGVFKQLLLEKYDLVIDIHNKLNTFIMKYLIKPNKIITYKKNHLLRFLIVKKLSICQIDTVVLNYFEAVNRLKLPPTPLSEGGWGEFSPNFLDKKIINKEAVLDKFMSFNIPSDKYLIGIFPGAKHITKMYPCEKLANLISNVPDSWLCCFVILGTWQDKQLFFKIKSLTNKKIYDLTGAFDTCDIVTAISLMDVVISNDSGAMHIAAALKKPQIAIYGATHTRLGFRPLNENAVILQKNISCQPCSLHGSNKCKKNSLDCFNDLDLFDTFKELFENNVVISQNGR